MSGVPMKMSGHHPAPGKARALSTPPTVATMTACQSRSPLSIPLNRCQTRAVCPYYLRDSRLKISCVPVTEQATCCAVEFDSEQEKRRYMQEHCFKRQCSCAVRRMLEGEQGGGFAEVRR